MNKKKLSRCIALLIPTFMILTFVLAPNIQLNSQAQSQTSTYYVSPSGDDNNPGTIGSPFKTIQKARDAVRDMSTMTQDVVIILREGTYSLSDSIILDERDSGKNGFKVIYKAYENENPIIDGGISIPNSSFTSVGNGIYKATLNDVDNFRQLYINGVKANRARSSSTHTATAYHYDTNEKIDGYIVNDNVIDYYSNMDKLELVWSIKWRCHRLPVSKIINAGNGKKAIIMKQPYLDWSLTLDSASCHPKYNAPFYIENALELLDQKGEWYYDEPNKELYYMPRDSEDISTASIYIPQVEKLMTIKGSSPTNQVNNIIVKDLTFQNSTWIRPSIKGASSMQASFITNGEHQAAYTSNGIIPPAAIELEHANNINIDNNKITRLGAVGIKMENDVQDTKLTNNTIKDTSADAIVIGTWNHNYITEESGEGLCTNISVRNNTINNIANEYWASPAITVYYGKLIDIQHNDISDTAYSAISMGWNGWSYWEQNSSNIAQNRISWNRMSDFMKTNADGGAIYSLNVQPDTVWQGNYIKNMHKPFGALYPDEGSGYLTIKDNVVENIGSNRWLHMWINTVNHVYVTNNYTTTTNMINNATKGVVVNTHHIPDGNWPTEAVDIINNSGITSTPYEPLVPIEVNPDNLAYKKRCLAYYIDGTKAKMHMGSDPWRAVDGYASSYSVATDQYAWKHIVDLEGRGTINKVIVKFPLYETLYATDFKVNLSINGEDYTTVSTITGCNGGTKEITFSPTQARYVMIEAIKPDAAGQTGNQMAIGEIEVYGNSDFIEIKNLARHKPSYSSSNYNCYLTASKANNGLENTLWASSNDDVDPTPWWKVDLGSSYKIGKIELVSRQDEWSSDAARRNFDIQASNTADFSTYTTLGSQGSTAFEEKGTWTCNANNSSTFRYIRVIRTGTTDHHFNFAELRVYEDLSD